MVIVFILTLIINFIGIAALATRIVGVRTRKLASSSSLFNIILLVAQFARSLQAPLLTKFVETGIVRGEEPNDSIFRYTILAATLGSILGGLAIPSVQRFMEKGVNSLYRHHSVFMVVVKSFKITTIVHLKNSIKMPDKSNFLRLTNFSDMRVGVILLNIFVYSFTTVGALSCLYAGYLNPALRTTSLSMSGIANAAGTIGMLLFIEPYNSILTDKVVEGTVSDGYFRRYLSLVVLARCFGTFLGLFLLVPLARLITALASFL